MGLVRGCDWKPHCRADSCAHGSRCVELWTEHRCECRRPFLQPDCVHQLPEATFGHRNRSSAAEYLVAAAQADGVAQRTELSLILRSNRPEGQLFFLGQAEPDSGTFLAGRLQNGTFHLDARLGGVKVFSAQGTARLDDNLPHMVQVARQGNRIEVCAGNFVFFDFIFSIFQFYFFDFSFLFFIKVLLNS